ncbi:MAG: lysophospholipid acyltransferase family protein [Ignavibacteria bacterium]|nr:lysophospholipid acyltransferase family protein [Ignavibacteria bacterium]
MISALASFLIRVLGKTWNVDVQGRLPTGPCIVAFWHDEMLPVWFAFRALRPVALVSASSDGQILSQLLRDWCYDVVTGSSSSGGKEALDELVTHASSRVVLITPDGPRGPRHVCKPGVVVAAHRAGIPLIMVRASSGFSKRFKGSWDSFMLPLPFAGVKLTISAPLHIPSNATREEIDAFIQAVTNSMETLGSEIVI